MSPVHQRLIAAWALLMALTISLAVAADVTHASRLGAIWLVVIAMVTIAKVRLVLSDYLGLKGNRGALNGMTAAVAIVLATVVAAFIAIRP